jgi:hypothetical protein
MITTNFVRQPTHFQKHWFRYSLIGLTTVVASAKFIQFAVSGDLTKFIDHAKFVVAEQYQERFKVPISEYTL